MFAPMFKRLSLFSSLVVAVEHALVEKGEYFISKPEITAVEEKTDIIIEERIIREEQAWSAPEVLTPQTITDREDDWFVVLDGIPRETLYVPPGTPEIPLTTHAMSVLCLGPLVLKRFLLKYQSS